MQFATSSDSVWKAVGYCTGMFCNLVFVTSGSLLGF